jgi:TPR repeat protein
MAFAELSSSLLVRKDTDCPVSVPVTSQAAKAAVHPLPAVVIEEPERRRATNPTFPSLSEPDSGLVDCWRGVRLISCIVCCVAAIAACLLFIDYGQTRTIDALSGRADNPDNVEYGTEAAVAPPLDVGQHVTSAHTPDEHLRVPVPSTKEPLPDTAQVSPVAPAVTNLGKLSSANSAPAPERELGLSKTEVAELMERGDSLFSIGDITSARLFYQYAAEAGDGAAALRLGEAFDPAFLERARLSRALGDAKKALHWYLRASELGNEDAKLLLQISSAPAYPEK